MKSPNRLRAAVTLAMLAGVALAHAQTAAPAVNDRAIMDQAMGRAKENAKVHKPLAAPMLSYDQLRQQKAIDPSQLAEKYRNAGTEGQKASEDLMVFVSLSMSPASLKKIAEQANKSGAIVVLRGFKGGLRKGAMQQTFEAIKPLADTGAQIQINPEAFTKYNVTAVPTFVIAAADEGCGVEHCAVKATALAGDVSLEYALETWANRGGEAGRRADAYLARLRDN